MELEEFSKFKKNKNSFISPKSIINDQNPFYYQKVQSVAQQQQALYKDDLIKNQPENNEGFPLKKDQAK